MFSDHKKQINEEKHVIKITTPNLLYSFNKCYVFYSITVKQTDKIYIEYMLIYNRKVHRKNHLSIMIRGQENCVSIFFTVLPFEA